MRRVLLLLVPLLICLELTAWAQDRAEIVGTVMDSSGGVMPKAIVTVSNPDKGFVRHLVSGAAGEYSISAVPIGNYIVTAEAPGFQKLVKTDIVLDVGQIQRVDMQLAVGTTTQEITVKGEVPHVQTETGAVSSVISSTQIENLELNGRNFMALSTLVPGANATNFVDDTHIGPSANTWIVFNGISGWGSMSSVV